jgi:Kef-type K+ transport system membrane component KefB
MIPNIPELPLTDADWLFAVLMGLVLLVPLVSERIRVPSVVGLVLAGALVGPGGLGLVVREGAVGTIGTVGLLYLMFLAGLELDLEEFIANKQSSIVFGILTFVIPMALGFASTMALGFGVLASVLIASCWASHTLLAYPIFRRHGTVGNRAVATAVGGTILTDTAALIVLVVVASAHQGELSVGFWASLLAGMAVLVVVTLRLLPMFGRWLFTHFAHEPSVRFVFVLFALLGSSALAHLCGMEPIIGAFLAGLALNRLIPSSGRLIEHLEFIGSNFLIPIFLLGVGLLVDFSKLAEPRTLLMGVVFTVVAVLAKFLAAYAGGKWLGYDRNEIGAMFALSNAQAAATLAAIVVGLRIGLIGEDVVNAVILVILVACLLASWAGSQIAPRLVKPAPRQVLGRTVVLPVVRPDAAKALTRVASAIAEHDSGLVLPLTVASPDAPAEALEELRQVNRTVEGMARGHGVEAEGMVRIDTTPAAGVLRTAREHGATLIISGWHGPDHRRMFAADALQPIVAESSCPVVLARLDPARTPKRVVVLAPHAETTEGGQANLRLTLEITKRLAALYKAPITAISSVDDPNVLAAITQALGSPAEVDARSASAVARERVGADDLLVVPVRTDDLRLRHAERINKAAADSQVVAVVGGVPAPPAPRPGRRRHAEVPLAPLA